MIDAVGELTGPASVAGLVIDAWVEAVPSQVPPDADPADPRPGKARTGLAVRSNAASSRPPQALLCAISPDGARWTTDTIRAVIEQTLDLARVRLVTLERLPGQGTALPALYARTTSLQGEKVPDFSLLASSKLSVMPFVKEATK